MGASFFRRYRRRRAARAILTGMAAGLAATLVMDQFQKLWSRGSQVLEEIADEAKNDDRSPESDIGNLVVREDQGRNEEAQDSEDSTVKLADRLVQFITGQPLPEDKKKLGGVLVHTSFGALMGGLYGAAVELDSRARAGYGTAFGAALFLGASEIGVPAVGLSQAPWKTPLSKHVQECLAHLVYGAAAEGARRVIRRVV